MSKYGKFMSAVLLLTWIVFIWFADDSLVHIVTSGIAGWAMGSWIFDFCYARYPKEEA